MWDSGRSSHLVGLDCLLCILLTFNLCTCFLICVSLHFASKPYGDRVISDGYSCWVVYDAPSLCHSSRRLWLDGRCDLIILHKLSSLYYTTQAMQLSLAILYYTTHRYTIQVVLRILFYTNYRHATQAVLTMLHYTGY